MDPGVELLRVLVAAVLVAGSFDRVVPASSSRELFVACSRVACMCIHAVVGGGKPGVGLARVLRSACPTSVNSPYRGPETDSIVPSAPNHRPSVLTKQVSRRCWRVPAHWLDSTQPAFP